MPDAETLVALHDEILRRTGGERGVLHAGAVEAAVARARRGHVGRPTRIEERAAFLLRGIAQDHPFVDGNKRTGFEAADLFLRRNGFMVAAPQEEIQAFMVRVAGPERLDHRRISRWLRPRLKKLIKEEPRQWP